MLPIWILSPSRSVPRDTGSPLTNVPLRDSRSTIWTLPSTVRSSAACWRETPSSSICTSHFGERPITIRCSRRYILPMLVLPLTMTSQGRCDFAFCTSAAASSVRLPTAVSSCASSSSSVAT